MSFKTLEMTDVLMLKEEHICKQAFDQLSRIGKSIIQETSAKVLLDTFSTGTKRFYQVSSSWSSSAQFMLISACSC